MSRVQARNPSRAKLSLGLPALLLAVLAAAPIARAQDAQIPRRVGPVPQAGDPRPLLDLTGGAAAGMAGEGGGSEELGVDPGSGAFTHSELEIFQPGIAGLDLRFERMHLSNAAYNGPLGWNWDSSLFMRIQETGAGGQATLHDGSFNRGAFAYAGSSGGVYRYTTPNSWFVELTRTGSGTGALYSMSDASGVVYRLEYDVQQGGITWYRLKDITDPNGNRISFAYDATTTLLKSITDSVGNSATLTWITSGPNSGRLQTFAAPGGATVTFVYDAAGNLVTARRPRPDSAVGTADQAMTYDVAHRLVSVQNAAAASPWLVNGYDGIGRVVSQQLGGPGQVITTNWSGYPLISVTDRLGQVTDYAVNPSTGDVTAHVVHDMSQPGFAWTTTFAWDVHHHLVREVRPDGETFEWTWETSTDPKRRDNMVRFEHKSQPTVPGLVSTWSYTAGFNKLAWAMTPRANAQTGGVYSAAKATNYSYDTRGNMTQVMFPVVTTPVGTQTVSLGWTWDARGRISQFTGPRGLVSQFKYTDTPVLRPFATRVISDPNGAAVADGYAYDTVNRMTQSTRPCACGGSLAKATFSYDAGRRLRQVVVDLDSATKRQTFYDHDLDGRTVATRVQDDSPVGDGWAVNGYTFDLLGNMLAASEDVDASTKAVDGYGYDADGRLVQKVTAAGVGSEWSYDERDLVTERRLTGDPADPTDDVVETLQRDLGGRVSRVDRADGTWETYTYDGYARLATVTDTLGRVTTYAYDEDDRMLSEELRSAGGALLDLWTFAWDEMGRLSQMEQLALDDSGAPLGGGDGMLTTVYEHDASGNVVSKTREDGTQVTQAFDLFERMVSVRDALTPVNGLDIEYHASGMPYRLWAVEGDPATGLSPRRLMAEWTTYDLAGRPTELRDALGKSSFYTWSLRDSITRYVDRNGQRVDQSFDERGQLLSHRRLMKPAAGPLPDDLLYEYGYDLDGRLSQTVARNAPFGPDQTTSLLFDSFGLLSDVVWPDGSSEGYDYDAALRVSKFHDPRGNVVAYSYDAQSRPTDVAISRAPGVGGTTAEHYDYDLRDNVTLARNDDYDVTRTYSSLRAQQSETILDRITGLTRTSRADHDPSGRLVRLQYPSHTAAVPDALLLAWDSSDRLASLKKQEGGTLRTVAQFEWMGERLLRRWGGPLETVATWDALGRPSTTLHRRLPGGQPIASFEQRYDATSHVTGVLRTFYDAAGNPLPDGASGGYGGGQDNQYDAAYRLTASRGGISTTDWLLGQVGSALLQTVQQYDRNENRTQVSTNSGGPLWQLTQYVSGLINEYLSVGGAAASYDGNGNLVSMPGGPTILAYDYTNRPVNWSENGLTGTARYDAIGRRIATSDATKAEIYTYFDFYPLEQMVAGYGAPVREFVYGDSLDEVLEIRDAQSGASYPVASNELGSPVALMSGSGSIIESYRYSTFGRRFAASPTTGAILPGPSSSAGFPVAFGGRLTLNGSDSMLDFRARTYLPDWGRFAEQDPLGYPNGRLNRYQLSGNDPYRKDNFGLHEPGNINDPPGTNTHSGITNQAGKDEGLNSTDNRFMRDGAIYQDNSKNVAFVPFNGGSFKNHFPYHALGRTQAEQEAQLRKLIEDALTRRDGWCSPFRLGWALHYAQDMVAHRTLAGEIYDETLGHAADTLFGFNPDGPEDPDGDTMVTHSFLFWSWKSPKDPHGAERHRRKLVAIKNSRAIIKEFMDRCGPGTGGNYWFRYRGGRPDEPWTPFTGSRRGPTTGGGKKGPTTGGPTTGGPTTGGSTGGKVDKPQTKGPTTGGGGVQTPPACTGPTTPSGGGPTKPGPSTGGPTTGGPSGPTTPTGPSTGGNPQGPTTPGPGTPTGPITPGGETGPQKPVQTGGEDPPKSGGG